ncbi:DNA repair exonuclease [bacterium]|nr:DNA repair exonuclease [candidate division CSSED10-310 bacterium]
MTHKMQTGRSPLRILFTADTHLGFDLPERPRVNRRRRGHDFFANYQRIIQRVKTGDIDMFIHGGDLFYRSRIPQSLLIRVFEPLFEIADLGIPVCIIPGNHERSRIPFPLLASYSGIHVFHKPQTLIFKKNEMTIQLSAFPFIRKNVREMFKDIKRDFHQNNIAANLRILCMHQAVDGARVGVQDFCFRNHPDVVDIRDLQERWDVVLAGHIHRHQILQDDLHGRKTSVPVIYAGSIERTSFAERQESKGFVILEANTDTSNEKLRITWKFERLPDRPMCLIEIWDRGQDMGRLQEELRCKINGLNPETIVRIKFRGGWKQLADQNISVNSLRELAPSTMNIDFGRF